jgi:hypothetical protein
VVTDIQTNYSNPRCSCTPRVKYSPYLCEGMSGNGLVSAVVEEWEQVVKKVARAEVGEKVVVCGRADRWWDDEIKQKIEQRIEVYKKFVKGHDNLWEEYREVKNLVVERSLRSKMARAEEITDLCGSTTARKSVICSVPL